MAATHVGFEPNPVHDHKSIASDPLVAGMAEHKLAVVQSRSQNQTRFPLV